MRRSRPPMPASKHSRVARPKPALPDRAAFLTTCVTYCLAEPRPDADRYRRCGPLHNCRLGRLPGNPLLASPTHKPPLGQSPQGPSFLGTAAATAAGMVGGALLLDGVRSALGGHQGGPFAKTFGELNAESRFDDGSHEATSAGYDQAGDAYDTGDTDFADVGGLDDGSGGGLDSA